MRARQSRALRGAAASALTVFFAALSHTIGGGAAPSLAVLLGVGALSWPVTTVLVGQRLRPAGLFGAVALAQAALHGAFALTTGLGTAPHGALHQHGAITLGPLDGASALLAPTPVMLTAHLCAAIASFVVLFVGERTLCRVLVWTYRRLGRARVVTRARATAIHSRFPDVSAPSLRHARGPASRRGPPLQWGDLAVA